MDVNYWLNTEKYTTFQLSIALIGSVLWVMVYFFLIKDTLQRKYMEMPFFIACGNFAWEILYAYFFDSYIDLGKVYIYGYRAWFYMDIFIFILLLKYGPKQTDNLFIKKNFKSINIGILFFFLVILYAWISEGFDNTPIHGDGSVKLGATSAYVLNFGITVLYISLFLKDGQTQKFSKPIAWCKAIGTGLFTVLFWQVDPENYLLQTLGVLIALGDIFYIGMLYSYKSQKSVMVDLKKIKFTENKIFEKLWNDNPAYLIVKNNKIRYYESPDWNYKSPDGKYETSIGVAEGNILVEIAKGEVEFNSAKAGLDMVDRIVKELGLENQNYYYISDTKQISKASFDVRSLIVNFHETRKNLKQFILISNGFTRVLIKLMNPISPEVINNWITSDNLENAMYDLFHHESEKRFEYFENNLEDPRIEKVYDIISKISIRQFDKIEKVELPESDKYFGIFTALDILKNDNQEILSELNTLLYNSRKALKEQELYFQSLFENSNEYVLVIDSNDKLINFNAGIASLASEFGMQIRNGYNVSNYLDTRMMEFYHNIKQDLLEGKKKEFVIDYKKPDNNLAWYNCKAYSVKISEKITYMVFFLNDITEEKNLKEESQQLKQTIFNQSLKINEFSSVLSNNLRQHPEKIATAIENLKKSLVFTSVNIHNIAALRNALDDLDGVLQEMDKVLNETPLPIPKKEEGEKMDSVEVLKKKKE